ncbi:MAG: hypothetical protein IPP91_14165 [Betaproteobacteria bacterium]|nr:hypothetical protein [Betaproteobacteria bacterium]
MSNIEQKPVAQPEGELSEQQLDSVSGGQQVVKLEKITVTAKREQPQQMVKLDKVTVTGKREPPLSGTQIASAEGATKKN